MAAGLLALPLSVKLEKAASAGPEPAIRAVPRSLAVPPSAPDPRTTRLKQYFSMLRSPVFYMAEDFIHAADDNRLDWRLLPSISVVESGGGKDYVYNNIFGWGVGGPIPFPSIRAGLNLVAFKLGQSELYRNLDIPGKLRIYNHDVTYPSRVMDVMSRISRTDLTPKDTARLVRRDHEFVYVAN